MLKHLYLNSRLFFILFIIGVLYILSFFFGGLMPFAHSFLALLLLIFTVDAMLLFNQKKGVEAQRILPEKLSNGDENIIRIDIKNNYFFPLSVQVIDEIPFQFQVRDFMIHKRLPAGGSRMFEYKLTDRKSTRLNSSHW